MCLGMAEASYQILGVVTQQLLNVLLLTADTRSFPTSRSSISHHDVRRVGCPLTQIFGWLPPEQSSRRSTNSWVILTKLEKWPWQPTPMNQYVWVHPHKRPFLPSLLSWLFSVGQNCSARHLSCERLSGTANAGFAAPYITPVGNRQKSQCTLKYIGERDTARACFWLSTVERMVRLRSSRVRFHATSIPGYSLDR
jgi:hypothetical protein